MATAHVAIFFINGFECKRKSMKKFWLFLLFIGLTATAFADVKIISKIEINVSGKNENNSETITTYIKGDKRIVIVSNPNLGYTLFDLNQKKMYIIQPAKKMVKVLGNDVSQAMNNMAMQLGQNVSIQKTANTKMINGFKCQEFIFTMAGPLPMTGSIWASEDVNKESFGGHWNSVAQDALKKLGSNLSEIKGFPIRTEIKAEMNGTTFTTINEVQSITFDTLPSFLFIIPPDYQVDGMSQ
jgi:hypothetical protein